MTNRCIIVGDVMMDITGVIDGDIAYGSDTPARIGLQPGGVAANTAAWMALDGHPVTLIGCVGDDEFGRLLREHLSRIGISSHLGIGSRPTGTCMVIVDRRHERTMFPDTGANADIALEAIVVEVAAGDHLHLSGYTLMNPSTRAVALGALEHARAVGATVSLDPASAAPLRSHVALMHDVLARVDLVLANEAEASVLTGFEEPHEALVALGDRVPTAVVKIGSRGALASRDGQQVERPAVEVAAVDTTGAGDAFTAGFLPPWLAQRDLATCLDAAQTVAARAVGRVGASPLR